ncbi:MAG: 1-deoxy-D-xylulose-5-phosphate reductoisomerase [Bacilli bacterium]|nr:1-deoxy-D-xylulose-5-phosphate reductoisomerase [Bacilli bacterium]
MRQVCLLGASGSIGKQTIDVIKKNPSSFSLVAFSVGKRTRQINYLIKYFPSITHICVQEKKAYNKYKKQHPNITFYYGDDGLIELIKNSHNDMVVNALVGFVGLKPTIVSLKLNKIVCLANKEALVVGGELVNKLLDEGHGKLYPIDSEHVALAKCLAVDDQDVDKLIITASGGAFRRLSRDELTHVKASDALKHPTWKMGAKITIDCATMVNKSFEVIEAHYLFRYPENKIDILLHDESMIHSLVLYNNGVYRLDHGKPDMRIPIKYALFEGLTDFKTVVVKDYHVYKDYHFRPFDIKRYPIVKWAKFIIENKGTYGAVFNASNEVAVHAFLKDEIPFLMIEEIINHFMKNHQNIKNPSLEQLIQVDKEIRKETRDYIERSKR